MHAQPHERPIEVSAPYVAEMVRQEMLARFGGDVLTKGYHVTTTIDPALQAAATQAVRDGLTEYDHRHGWREVEQHFDLAAGEDAATASARAARDRRRRATAFRRSCCAAATARPTSSLADGSTRHAGCAPAAAGPAAAPSALVKRGDLVRVRR